MLEDFSIDNGVVANHPQDLASHFDTIMNLVVSLSQRVDAQVSVTPHPEEASSTSHHPTPRERGGRLQPRMRLCRTSPLIKRSDRVWRRV